MINELWFGFFFYETTPGHTHPLTLNARQWVKMIRPVLTEKGYPCCWLDEQWRKNQEGDRVSPGPRYPIYPGRAIWWPFVLFSPSHSLAHVRVLEKQKLIRYDDAWHWWLHWRLISSILDQSLLSLSFAFHQSGVGQGMYWYEVNCHEINFPSRVSMWIVLERPRPRNSTANRS